MSDTSLIVLFDQEGKMLFQHRDAHAPIHANQWSLFGGGIEEGETPEEAVIRETKEELDIAIKNPLLVGEREKEKGGTHYYFIAKWTDKNALRLLEGDRMDWFTITEAHTIGLPSTHKTLLLLIEDNIKKIISKD